MKVCIDYVDGEQWLGWPKKRRNATDAKTEWSARLKCTRGASATISSLCQRKTLTKRDYTDTYLYPPTPTPTDGLWAFFYKNCHMICTSVTRFKNGQCINMQRLKYYLFWNVSPRCDRKSIEFPIRKIQCDKTLNFERALKARAWIFLFFPRFSLPSGHSNWRQSAGVKQSALEFLLPSGVPLPPPASSPRPIFPFPEFAQINPNFPNIICLKRF